MKSYKYRQAGLHPEDSLPSFLHSFSYPLSPFVKVSNYSWGRQLLKRIYIRREESLEWNTRWDMVRVRRPHEWKWSSPQAPHSGDHLSSPLGGVYSRPFKIRQKKRNRYKQLQIQWRLKNIANNYMPINIKLDEINKFNFKLKCK